MDALTRDTQRPIPHCMVCADDIVLVEESKEELST